METAETTTNELILRMEERYSKMSKGQRRLADYVRENYDKAVFLTAAKLGETVGVSESTVRACKEPAELDPEDGSHLRQDQPE